MTQPSILEITNQPFSLSLSIGENKRSSLLSFIEKSVEKTLGLDQLSKVYNVIRESTNPIEFIDRVLENLHISVDISDKELAKIPENGSVVIMANHPFGGIEGLIMAKIILQRRPDVKLLANDILKRIPELKSLFYFVDPFGNSDSIKKNISGVRQVKKWLQDEHVLGVFPAGEVAAFNPKKRKIIEPDWNENCAKFAFDSKATVVPMFFSGSNSFTFHLAGMIHPRLRTALLGRQVVNKKNHRIKVSIGTAIKYKEYQMLKSHAQSIRYFESRTFMLKKNHQELTGIDIQKDYQKEVLMPVSKDLIAQEIANLDSKNRLVSTENFDVFIAQAAEIPNIITEIGRLRELSFRLVGEGSGNEIDVDHFDNYYQQLFIWDKSNFKIVGAYRLAMIDSVVDYFGKQGLYTHSLFKLKQNFLDQVFPGIELGRSFVHPDYQKSYQPLLLLWKGITAFVYKNPNYRYLIGAVSISKDYSELSKQIMMSFLQQNHWNNQLAESLKPRNPYTNKKESVTDRLDGLMPYLSIEHVNAMVRELDPDMGGVPILIKQYLKMKGKFAGFNVDSSFSDVVDGLIIVDLLKSDPESLNRYMGEAEYKAYIEHHQVILPEFDEEMICF